MVKLGILNYEIMRNTRSYAILAIVVIAALITPTPDVATLGFLAIPMIILYEICIWLSFFHNRKQREAELKEQEELRQKLLASPAYATSREDGDDDVSDHDHHDDDFYPETHDYDDYHSDHEDHSEDEGDESDTGTYDFDEHDLEHEQEYEHESYRPADCGESEDEFNDDSDNSDSDGSEVDDEKPDDSDSDSEGEEKSDENRPT